MPLFGFHPSRLFALGGLCTVSATVLYSWAPTQWPEGWTAAGRHQQRRRATASLELEALDEELLVECGHSADMGASDHDQSSPSIQVEPARGARQR